MKKLMMNRILFIFIFVFIPCLIFSQSDRHQTYIKTDKYGNTIEKKASNFGMQIGFGVSLNYHDSKTRKYFGNYKGSTYSLAFFYTNFSLGFAFKPIGGVLTAPTDTLLFKYNNNYTTANLSYVKTEIVLGYTFDLPWNTSFEPTVGYLSTSFRMEDQNGDNIESISRNAGGLTLGFSINKYIKFPRMRDYLVIYLNNNINYSNYSKFNSSLGNCFYSIEFGIAVKGWFAKKN